MKQTKLLTLLAVSMALIALAAASAVADLAPGVTLDFNANDPASGISSSSWVSLTATQDRNWSPGADVTLVDVSGGTSLSKAYRFTGGSGATASSWDKFAENADTTWEIWVKPADTGAANQVIFETGGSGDGMAIWYTMGTAGDGTGTIKFTIDNGSNQGTAIAEIDTADFHHIVMVYDKDYSGSDDLMEMYVDGQLADTVSAASLNDWAGGDGATLGNNGGLANGVSGGAFTGDLSILRFWENKALTAGEVGDNFSLFAGGGATIIYPENGQVVPPGDVILQWENIDDANNANPVYVEVGWGTDPNRYTGGYTIAATGNDITTATVSPAGPGVYYWYVDNTVTLPGQDPCTIEGRVNMFTNDGPIVSVDAGPDMVTWTGEPVGLVAGVVDDGGSTLTYSWTIDSLPAGVTAVFDPSADVAETAVTLTKAPYTNANVPNAGFEAEIFADGDSAWMSPQGWSGNAIGLLNPGAEGTGWPAFGGIAPEGENVLFVNAGGSASTVLSETLQEGANYILSVEVGLNQDYGSGATYQVQLLAGDTVIAEDDNGMNITLGTFETSIVTYEYDAVADANKVGLPLQIRFNCTSGGSTDVEFDNVVLTSDTPFPVQDVSSIDVTLTVQDETNPAVSDTTTIEVYNDACHAARDGKGYNYDTDYDISCLIDLEDLAEMALAWLTDTSATEAVVNPIQPEEGLVVNGKFAMYKPGTAIPVVSWGASGYDIWVTTIGYDRPLSGSANDGTPGYVTFADGETGTVVDIPGWATPIAFGGAAATNACDLFSAGYAADGTSTLNAFGSWSGQNGTLAQSADPIVLPIRGSAGAVYTLKAMSLGNPAPKTFSLVVDGVEITPASSVDPVDTATWQEISRTYDSSSIPAEGDVTILVGTKRPDETIGNPSLTGNRWRVDNIALDYEITDPAIPYVDAGPDMVTWAGQPVPMSPTVTVDDPNNPNPTLIYSWTTDEIIGLDIDISDPAIEAPTVTITPNGAWRDVPVINPSFEDREIFDPFNEGDDKYFQWGKEAWRQFEVDNNGGPMRIWNPGVQGVNETTQGIADVAFGGNAPDGKYIGVVYTRYNDNEMSEIRPVRDWEALTQIVGDPSFAFNPNANYKLTVKVGRLPEGPDQGGSINYLWDESDPNNPGPVPGWNGYAVQLVAGGKNVDGSTYAGRVEGGTVVAEDYNTLTVDPNGFVTVTVDYAAGTASADLAGLPLQIRLCALENPDDHSTTSYAAFDDVKLITDAPPLHDPIKVKLTVNSEGSATKVSDAMAIKVYETPCDVTKAVLPETIDQTDHNIDCITNLMDFAVIAEDWLMDYKLTAAEPK